ncbi:MAG: NFACT RNA binding domain-containing protein [Candidatus Woesearchaeota archaeon]
MKVEIYINKTVEENASIYYEKAKKAKKKYKGALETIERFESELAKLKIKEEQTVKKAIRKKQWFEKFRWFITSSGFLVIGGRDATTNEIIIKKHTESNDLVFHTDMAGSPFFVIKSNKKTIDENSIKETADATCSFSRAWKLGLNSTSVFYVKPDQVTKEANSGEYLTKGAFMIRGKTNYVDNKINLAIGQINHGEYKDIVMCAPIECIKKSCDNIILLKQGDKKPSDIAKKVKGKLKIDIDEIIRLLPPGNLDLPKERKKNG